VKKIIIAGLSLALVIFIFLIYFFSKKPQIIPFNENEALSSPISKETTTPTTLYKSQPVASSSSDENRIQNLEKEISKLKEIVATFSSSVNSSKQPLKRSPLYIPLGTIGETGDQSYIWIEASEAIINPNEYDGYSSMQLQVSLKLTEQIGVVSARVFNQTDQQPVSNSEVSSKATDYVLLTSSGFKLPPGQKTYRLQVSSSLGNNAYIQNARIKVNF
jgi:hypothetical protein